MDVKDEDDYTGKVLHIVKYGHVSLMFVAVMEQDFLNVNMFVSAQKRKLCWNWVL